MSQKSLTTVLQVIEVIPLIMRTIRIKFRERRTGNINVAQFRVMAYLNNNTGASLSDLAYSVGLTLPALSSLVDHLVSRNLIAREKSLEDRRKITLSLTQEGQKELNTAYQYTQRFLEEKLSSLSDEDLEIIIRSIQILRNLFQLEGEEELAF